MARIRIALIAAAGLIAGPASVAALQSRDPVPPESLLVTAEWLRAHRAAPDLILLHIGHRMEGGTSPELIPGSVELDYMAIVADVAGVRNELPSLDSLRTLFEAAGISNTNRVVVYSRDPIMAARGLMTLEAAGHQRVHLLDGGAPAWKALGGAVVSEPDQPPAPGRFVPRAGNVTVDADWIRKRLDDGSVALIDTRTVGEYTGQAERRGMPSEGHLPGARLLLWQDLLQEPRSSYFKPREELSRIFRERGAAPGATVVTYCAVGYRASLSYFVARYLGYEARLYDGSYDDWSRRQQPLVRGESPR